MRPLLPMLRLAFPPRRPSMRAPERILVSELWHIGDVVLAMPFLAALRTLFPDARITLLGRAHARETLKHTGLVDDFVSFDFPWTFLDEDRRPTIRELLKLPGVIRRLRLQKFDLAFDCSRDGRNNLVLFLSGSARRIGFAFGGGEFLLTDAVPVGSLNEHRTADWLRLLEPFEVEQRRGDFADARENGFDARLAVSDTERRWAQDFLREHGHSRGDVLIAVHAGGSSRLKRWPLSHFESLARTAATSDRARILWIVDPAGTGADANLPVGSIVARPSLRELIALLSESALLVSNDGGPMHLAGALGIPTFAVYSWGNPEWWRPYSSARHSFVRREDISCRPCAGHCIFPEPICLTGLSYQTVADEFAAELARLRKDEGLSLQVHSFQQSSR
ncbi:MAG TPA: glycosyltransferase family 9 protein [Gemmatimonadaceae bacterium]|nr:glycosyltransferase family 9 protein [Gemmatimonadaceae bacterium]